MTETILITGTSRGIGLALALQALKRGYRVIGTSRKVHANALNHPDFRVMQLDLASLESVTRFAQQLKNNNTLIDILINNAGIGPDLDQALPQQSSFHNTFCVNVTGTTFLTEQLLSQVKKNGKIINISSKMGSVANCTLSDSVAYRMSKSALNMYTKILSNRLTGEQAVAAIHPGWVRTTISASCINGRLSPNESAEKIMDFVESNFDSGIFWNIETQNIIDW